MTHWCLHARKNKQIYTIKKIFFKKSLKLHIKCL